MPGRLTYTFCVLLVKYGDRLKNWKLKLFNELTFIQD